MLRQSKGGAGYGGGQVGTGSGRGSRLEFTVESQALGSGSSCTLGFRVAVEGQALGLGSKLGRFLYSAAGWCAGPVMARVTVKAKGCGKGAGQGVRGWSGCGYGLMRAPSLRRLRGRCVVFTYIYIHMV